MLRRSRCWIPLVLLCLAGLLAPQGSQVSAQQRPGHPKANKPAKALAPRPVFDAAVRERFFADVREHLGPGGPGQGTPPTTPVDETMPEVATTSPSGTEPSGDQPTHSTTAGWAALIGRDNLEDEIKAQVPLVAEATKSPSKFKSGGYKQARTSFSLLAVLLGVVAQYDGDVRWREAAPALRDQLAHVAGNCKVGTDGSFKEAKALAAELATLMRGDAVAAEAAPTVPEGGWPKVSDRPPLMIRMEASQHGRLDVWTADSGEFKRQREKLLHEARLLRLLAEVIQDPGYEFAEDEQYLKFAKELADRAQEIVAAIEQEDFAAAQSAVSRTNQACDRCHTDFRG